MFNVPICVAHGQVHVIPCLFREIPQQTDSDSCNNFPSWFVTWLWVPMPSGRVRASELRAVFCGCQVTVTLRLSQEEGDSFFFLVNLATLTKVVACCDHLWKKTSAEKIFRRGNIWWIYFCCFKLSDQTVPVRRKLNKVIGSISGSQKCRAMWPRLFVMCSHWLRWAAKPWGISRVEQTNWALAYVPLDRQRIFFF